MKYFKNFTKHLKENSFSVPTLAGVPSDEDGTKVTPTKPAGTPAAGTPAAGVTPAPTKPVDKGAQTPLQNMLKEWSQKYSQSFKFINDKPFTTEVKKDTQGQYAMLLSVVVAEKKQAVQEAILSLVNILSDQRFKGYTVQIIGHTSTPGPKGREAVYNQALSERRALIVFNAVSEKALELKKDLSHIIYQKIGKGLTDPIILNDKVLDPLKIKQMDGVFDATMLDALSKSVEERQKINRRVIVTLPNYKEPVPIIKVAPVVKSQDERFDKIDVTGVEFMDDSYVLTEKATAVLDNIAAQIDKRSVSTQKIQVVYLSAHTDKARKQSDTNEKMMYILSLNRGLIVEKYLIKKMKSKVKFVRYACAGIIGVTDGDINGFDNEKRVQIAFDEDLPKAKKGYTQLLDKYKISVGGQIIPNETMKESILQDISAYFEDEIVRQEMVNAAVKKDEEKEYFKKIPREFWLPVPEFQALGEEKPDEFVSKVISLFRKMNNKYDTDIPPTVLFHDDLKNQTKTKENA